MVCGYMYVDKIPCTENKSQKYAIVHFKEIKQQYKLIIIKAKSKTQVNISLIILIKNLLNSKMRTMYRNILYIEYKHNMKI